jgi:hypothetical protein
LNDHIVDGKQREVMTVSQRTSRWIVAGSACAALIIGALGYFALTASHDAHKREHIRFVVIAFRAAQELMDANRAAGSEVVDQRVRDKWSEITQRQVRLEDATRVVFGQDGDIVVISDSLDTVVTLSPVPDAKHGWTCTVYPEPGFDSLCSKVE